ncbi:hypothetical protein [Paenibacillus riograndensis]|uniref:Putative membrane protein n=1 Tax=Paenibacillus riograndensis SBR5 TaxID=1073571 RepID=A0A0E3WJ91_9BACL|nr:hypothetical protein [Paenibacillus riograndensis]CQR58378.1 putative membrane protein [Paenibacillus riograndensis SBR5]
MTDLAVDPKIYQVQKTRKACCSAGFLLLSFNVFIILLFHTVTKLFNVPVGLAVFQRWQAGDFLEHTSEVGHMYLWIVNFEDLV